MSSEGNITVTTQVAKQLDSSLYSVAQDMLVLLYKKFPILTTYIFGITYAQLILAVSLFLFILFIRPLLIKTLIMLVRKITTKTKTVYDDRIVVNLEKPLKFTFLTLGLYVLVSLLYLNSKSINLILASMAVYSLFWILNAILDGIKGAIYAALAKVSKDLSHELAKFIIRVIKIVLWVVGASSILTLWGINVTALIASLGIGGLAFALAAKDTAANLFGSIAIMVDKSIKVDDWVKVDSVEGIVEDIGMRTTKIRTFYKSLVAIPNSIVANSNIENFSRRDIRRIKMRIGLTYDTTNEQIELIVKDIKSMLKSHSGIEQSETLMVNFDNFGDSAQEIFIYTFTNSANWQVYLDIREDINYKISKIVAKHGSGFAFPSQSIYVESMPAPLKQN
jgi:MscS family membrane protein